MPQPFLNLPLSHAGMPQKTKFVITNITDMQAIPQIMTKKTQEMSYKPILSMTKATYSLTADNVAAISICHLDQIIPSSWYHLIHFIA